MNNYIELNDFIKISCIPLYLPFIDANNLLSMHLILRKEDVNKLPNKSYKIFIDFLQSDSSVVRNNWMDYFEDIFYEEDVCVINISNADIKDLEEEAEGMVRLKVESNSFQVSDMNRSIFSIKNKIDKISYEIREN